MDANDMAVLDGYLEEDPLPGDSLALTALFRLTLSPTEDAVDEAILPCTVADPQLAHEVLHTLRPGDRLRVTGSIRLPQIPGGILRVCVSALEILDTAPPKLSGDAPPEAPASAGPAPEHDDLPPLPPLPPGASLAHDGELERFGPYVVHYDPDTTITSVWRNDGVWVGADAYPVSVDDLIEKFEQRTAAGES
jgi:hypothetical protein